MNTIKFPNGKTFEFYEETEVDDIVNIDFPTYFDDKKFLVTGPSCSGKSTLIEMLSGMTRNEIPFKIGFKYAPENFRFEDEFHQLFEDWPDNPQYLEFGLALMHGYETISPNYSIPKMFGPHQKAFYRNHGWDEITLMHPEEVDSSVEQFLIEVRVFDPQKVKELSDARHRKAIRETQRDIWMYDENKTVDQYAKEAYVYCEFGRILHKLGMDVYVRRDFKAPPLRYKE